MCNIVFRKICIVGGWALAVLLAGCVSPPPPAKTAKAPVKAAAQCPPVAANNPLVGKWLSVHKQKGVAGELHTLFALQPDGTMAYSEQIKRGKRPPQELNETGCWHQDQQTLTLQTTKSNGAPVEAADPIYKNRYTVVSQAGKSLSLRGPNGMIKAQRMPDGYRLPF